MTLLIQTPNTRAPERDYIIGVLLGDFLGLPWRREPNARADICITLADRPGELRLPDVLFSVPEQDWGTPASMPKEPLSRWDTGELDQDITLVETTVPVLYGDSQPHARYEPDSVTLPIDIFGSAFFMLSRYEELVVRDRDEHDRFPATASLAYKAGVLDRPIVDEYIEILWRSIKLLWPSMERKLPKTEVRVTCDVDHPFGRVAGSTRHTLGCMFDDIAIRRSPRLAIGRWVDRRRIIRGDYARDPYFRNIKWMMDVNEWAGNRMTFYFIAGRSHPRFDAYYNVEDRGICALIRQIHARGHEIGLHGSYNTYRDAEQTGREANRLRRVMEQEDVDQHNIGSRQHYLRWETPVTAQNLDRAGLVHDSTLSFADMPGFRCGTSHDYPMFDVVERRPLTLRQRPLILMECSVLSESYMNMGYNDEALDRMVALKRLCIRYGGHFTLLWHNSYFDNPADRKFYQELISN